MTQQDVFNYLSKNKGKWCDPKDISKELEINKESVNENLRRLYKQGVVVKKEVVKDSYKPRNFWRIR